MAKDLNVSPYWTTYETQFDTSKYKEVLFRPNKAVQARELIEAQLLNHKQLEANFNTLYKHGSVVSGCDLTVQTSDSGVTYYVYMSSGQFYYDGRVLDVAEQSVLIDNTGEEELGLYVKEEFITYAVDETLKDPASGTTNYGLDGADRLKITVELVKIMPTVAAPRPTLPSYQKYSDEDNLTVIWYLTDGVVQNYIRKPDYSILSKTLAKRTFHESGNYLVEGMKLDAEDSESTNKIKVTVAPGICYVRGYNNTYIVPKSLDVDKALNTQSFSNEPQIFSSGTLSYSLIRPYVVIDETVHDIVVTALVEKTISVTRGSGDYDTFEDIYGTEYTSINSIESIAGYVESTDFELSSDRIHWLATGSRPSVGVSYSVTFQYYKNCIRGTDFTVSENSTTDNIYDIVWSGTGDTPVDSSTVLVDYYTYMARTDLFSIDKAGSIVRSIGIDTDWDETLIPPFSDEMLPLGWIKFFPGLDYDDCLVYEYNFKRTTMFELHYMKKRINDLEENVATLALEQEVKEGEDSTNLKGIFVDAFNTMYRANVNHADYYASMNLIDETLQMVSNEIIATLNRTADTLSNIDTWSDSEGDPKYYTLDKTSETAFFSMVLKSDTKNLNPYGYVKKTPILTLNPSRDEWIDTRVVEKTVVNNEIRKTTTNKHKLQWVSNPTSKTQFVENKLNTIGRKVGVEKVELNDKLITYARQKTITVVGRNFDPAEIVTAVFGGFYVPLTAVSPYRNYTDVANSGKVIVGSNGMFKATFTIPENVKNGEIEFMVQDTNDNTVSTVYRSVGILKIIERRTTITKISDKIIDVFDIITPPKDTPVTPLPSPPPSITVPVPEEGRGGGSSGRMAMEDVLYDPVAQSFIFSDDRVLTAIDLYFGTAPVVTTAPVTENELYDTDNFSPNHPAILTIGYMKDGFPDPKQVVLMQEITPSEITTSLYGTIATHIALKKPIYIPAMQDFYISIGSKSTEYSVFVARLGEPDLDSGNLIMKNPYVDGTLFTSSNGVTWTPEQKLDLTCKLYEGVYASSGTITLAEQTFPQGGWTGFGRFIYMNNYIEVPNTSVQWYYSTDSGVNWTPCNTSEEIDLDAATTKLKLKCELSADSDNALTPIIDYQSNLVFFQYDTSEIGQYRSKLVDELNAYNNVKIILDESIRGSVSILKEFNFTDYYGDSIWFRIVHDADEEVDLENGYTRKTFVFDLDLLQRVSVSNLTGFTVGSDVGNDSWPTVIGKITAIDSTNGYIYVLRDGESSDEFEVDDTFTDGSNSTTVTLVAGYGSESLWPTDWTGRILMESTSYWRTPMIQNYRAIMRAI